MFPSWQLWSVTGALGWAAPLGVGQAALSPLASAVLLDIHVLHGYSPKRCHYQLAYTSELQPKHRLNTL